MHFSPLEWFEETGFLGGSGTTSLLQNIVHGYQGHASTDTIYHRTYLNTVVPWRQERNGARAARIDKYNEVAASIRERNGAACRIWDCPSIILDLASLGTSVAQTGSAACVATGVGTAPCGGSAAYFTALDLAISSGALVYEGGKWVNGGTTGSNLSLKTVEFGRTAGRAAGAVPSATPVVGIVYDGVVLLYDLVIAPFVNTLGGHGTAK